MVVKAESGKEQLTRRRREKIRSTSNNQATYNVLLWTWSCTQGELSCQQHDRPHLTSLASRVPYNEYCHLSISISIHAYRRIPVLTWTISTRSLPPFSHSPYYIRLFPISCRKCQTIGYPLWGETPL
jgi:hypothetical protein